MMNTVGKRLIALVHGFIIPHCLASPLVIAIEMAIYSKFCHQTWWISPSHVKLPEGYPLSNLAIIPTVPHGFTANSCFQPPLNAVVTSCDPPVVNNQTYLAPGEEIPFAEWRFSSLRQSLNYRAVGYFPANHVWVGLSFLLISRFNPQPLWWPRHHFHHLSKMYYFHLHLNMDTYI